MGKMQDIDIENAITKYRVDNPIFQLDLYSSLIGDKIGEGAYRSTYECPLNKDWVVKVSLELSSTSNIIEYCLWKDIENWAPKSVQKWFCPMIYVSPSGQLLIARKCETENIKKPKNVPHFLTDCRENNFGMLEGRLVILDYDYTLVSLVKHQMDPSNKKLLTMDEWEGGSFNI